MILLLSFLTWFALAPTQPSHTHVSTKADRETVLKACAADFGPEIDRKNNLFQVSHDYLLEAKFDNSGHLTQLGVLPKHWFADEHPEWNKTYDAGYLSVPEYKTLLRRLERIQPKGQLMQRAKFPVVTETIAARRDMYSSAVLVTSDGVYCSQFNPLEIARHREITNRLPCDMYEVRPWNTSRYIKYFVVYFTTTK